MKSPATMILFAALLGGGVVAGDAGPTSGPAPTFRKIQLTDKFWSEGVAIGDFNHDGRQDVCAGPFWYAGPAFKERTAYRPATARFVLQKDGGAAEKLEGFEGALGKSNAYSDDFMNFVYDFNGDQWPDILVVGMPGTAATWYENPQGKPGSWIAHRVFDVVDNESPMFADLDGCGKPELICHTDGFLGYARPDWSDPAKPWVFHKASPKGSWHKYTHGLGIGDINGDGRADMLLAEGWWEQPPSLAGDPDWKPHPFKFADGGAQIFACDVNGDGYNDVITCVQPHLYGLVWWEQSRVGGEIRFARHVITGSKPEESPHGIVFSEPHALAMADLDGDGIPDLVSGKRFWAHGPAGDVEPNAPAVLYWFKLTRGAGGADFVPQLIDSDSGVGMQIAVGDLDGDGKAADLAVSNKKGAFVFVQ
jgi:hypothetical protein